MDTTRFRPTPPRSVGHALQRGLGSALIVTAFITAATLGSAPVSSRPAPEAPVAPGSPEDLIQRHGCWTGKAPADMEGAIPGHVIVTRPGADAPEYGGARLVGLALDQAFNGADNGLTIHAFCR